jgi:hypothetical protein
MNILHETPKKSILKIQIAAMMLLILLASIWFALNSQPVQRYAPGNPGYEVMKRESKPSRSILVNLANGQTLVIEVA